MNYKIFTCTNFKYVEVAEYWAHHIQNLNLDYTVYCTDKKSFDFLTARNVKCDFYCELSSDNFNFTQFGLFRFNILAQLLGQYDYVIYSDADAIWLDNPLDDLFDHSYDAYLSTVHRANAYPKFVCKKWGMTICTGWMAFKSSAQILIKDFISQYHSLKTGNDQARFNKFLYSINQKIDKDVRDHSFILDLAKYQIKALGISGSLISRGSKVSGSKVVHPILGKRHRGTILQTLMNKLN